MSELASIAGHKGLQFDEPLLFEMDCPGRCGVDIEQPEAHASRLGGLARKGAIGLARVSEPQVVRHFTRLSQQNFSIDSGFYPLGSCTMKHNPRLNEKMARLPGFADLHPLQPIATVQGALELMDTLAHWLKTLTGMPAVAMSPGAGAHGELCGLMAMRACLEARGDPREVILVPESAHGTNPATAAFCGFSVHAIPADTRGRLDMAALKAALGPKVAGLMITNPNTCGLFENDLAEASRLVHEAGGLVYCDGANFNAIVGRVRPGDLGVDAMHINLHKTFSTPHGGGGPGSGTVVLSEALAPYAPVPYVVHGKDGFDLVEGIGAESGESFGRIKGFHGQMGMFVRALAYMMSHGADGLWQVSGDAVLNANYLLARLKDVLSPAYDGPCMHECVFDDDFLKGTGITTLDFVKALIDQGYHAPTIYFPLIVHGAMLMEPTESESKETLDEYVAVVRDLAGRATAGEAEAFRQAPVHTPRRRMDETAAARKPVLTWSPEPPATRAAE
ncbi:aminomethyl-transferring glycine dehydrogenase subunit GcvPB [Marinivivus vitaminiproducens]|uniref:aminomethyl-transferring glycine dehydrogenase subunit GcvPB n=1 Tax=Marinivivus vitaminiproducens TaxID=3035935 RepID=UPI0027A0A131|nr:aminomethyl-transferring glycine dehydrogenase subunit GcvPB [Geminicoccaceae bacterium SCSIO 64248]